MSTFSIEPTLVEEDSDESVEVLDSLLVGAIFVEGSKPPPSSEDGVMNPMNQKPPGVKLAWPGPRHEWREHTLYWQEPGIHAQSQLGDCYAMMADSILTRSQLFPGDEF